MFNTKTIWQQFFRCPQCWTLNRDVAKYCKNCGKQVNQKTIDEIEFKQYVISYVYKEKELSKDEINLIKQRINQWVNSVPHHNLANLAEKISIFSAKEIPLYEIVISFLFEERKILWHKVPYYGTAIHKKSVDIFNIDIWNFPVVLTKKEFEDSKKEYVVDGTQKVEICISCSGDGRIVCSSCSGRGLVVCSSCKGKGQNICFSCDGKGRKKCTYCDNGKNKCYHCNGRGFTESREYVSGEYKTITTPCRYCAGGGYISCDICAATGYVLCSSCDGVGRIRCSRCDATGVVQCYKCDGSGKIKCDSCNGQGEVLTYNSIEQKFYIKTSNSIIWDSLDIKILFDENNLRCGERIEEVFKNQKVCVVEVISDSIENLKQLLSNSLDEVIKNNLILSLTNDLPKDNHYTKLAALKVSINKLPVYQIKYNFQSKEYNMYLSGSSILHSSIVAIEDPLKEFVESLVSKFKVDIENSDFVSAWDTFSKIEDLQYNKKELISLLKLAIDKSPTDNTLKIMFIKPKIVFKFFIQYLKNYCDKVKTKSILFKIGEFIFEKFCVQWIENNLQKNKIKKLVKFMSLFYKVKNILDEENFKQLINTEIFKQYTVKIFNKCFVEHKNLLFALKIAKLYNPFFEQKINIEELLKTIKEKWKKANYLFWFYNTIFIPLFLPIIFSWLFEMSFRGIYSLYLSVILLTLIVNSLIFSILPFLRSKYGLHFLWIPSTIMFTSIVFSLANKLYVLNVKFVSVEVMISFSFCFFMLFYVIAKIRKNKLLSKQ